MYTDLMRRHPGSPNAPVCGVQQSDGNRTLDVPAHPQLGLPPLCGHTTGYPFQGCRRLHAQQSIHQGKTGVEVPALLEACLQLHPLLPPLCLLQTLLRSFHGMGLGVSVHDTHVVNTVCPVLT